MTSIEWLKEKLFNDFGFAFSDNIFEQAKEMEKQQIIDAHIQGHNAPSSTIKNFDAQQYYNETYGSNSEIPNELEISDEMSKIEKALYHAWSDYEYKEGNLYSTTFRDGWLMAIDWYKKQLNNK